MEQRRRLLLVGLGNWGDFYSKTRHNAGMLLIDYFCARLSMDRSLEKTIDIREQFVRVRFRHDLQLKSPLTSAKLDEISLVKPISFMNNCGTSIRKLVSAGDFKADEFVICHDEMEVKLGRWKWKQKGSPNGHNGLKSIIQALRHDEFQRLRIGIGRPESRDPNEISSFVLGQFPSDELSQLNSDTFAQIFQEFQEPKA